MLVLATLSAVFLAACGGVGSVATVEGESVSFDEVATLMSPEGDTVDKELFARSLMLVIATRVLVSEAARQFDMTFTEAEVVATTEELLLRSGQTREEVKTAYGLTDESLRVISIQQMMTDRLIPVLAATAPGPTEDELMARYEEMVPGVAEVCSSHILLESREQAEAALARAQAGEDFAALAVELSVGPSGPGGGDLGCNAPGGFVREFADAVLVAEVGAPHGPVETSFGWHVIFVSERSVPTFEEMRATIEEEIRSAAGANLWDAWLTGILTGADVTVEPEYGTWTTEPAPNVLPPTS